MRIFYALTLTDEDKDKIKPYRQLVEKHCDKGKFSRPENYHITLQYIGEIQPSQLDKYKQVLKKLSTFPKQLTVNQFGTFGKRNKEIVWLGVEKKIQLVTLQQEVVQNTKAIGVEIRTEKYVPHITIARQVVGFDDVNTLTIAPIELTVKSVALMESTRINDLLTYVPLEEIVL